jgi:DNA-binding GntR family transcriptional regulator
MLLVEYDCPVPRELQYLRIAAELRRLVASGQIAPGHLLPSESELADEHGVSRVTIRKALAQLKGDGIIDSRQGFGWYAVGAPLRQSLRDLTTIERQIRAAGREPSRELVRFAFRPTPPLLTEVLATESVLEITRIDRIDGAPFATATVWVRADLAADLSPRSLERRPLSEQLGIELGGATQTITAVGATKEDAGLLGVPKGAPLLRVERTTRDAADRPILRSEARYNPLLTELVADLPPAVHDLEPGLRLIPDRASAEAAWNGPGAEPGGRHPG